MPTAERLLVLPEVQLKLTQRARKTARPPLFSLSDYDDLRQELSWHLCQMLSRYTEEQGALIPFVHKILRNRSLNLIRQRQRQIPGGGIVSWQQLLDDSDVPEPTADRRLPGREAGESSVATDLRLTFAEFVDGLPPDLRPVAEDLSQGLTIAEIARKHNLPRSTLTDRVRLLRARLLRGGLLDSPGNVPSSAPAAGVVNQ